MQEIWKDIKGYEGKYQISNLGNVKSLKFINNKISINRDKTLKQSLNGSGYLWIILCINGTKKIKSIHRLVAETFIDKNDIALEVNHKDGNKLNNTLENLEWVTKSQNHKHRHHILGFKAPTPNKGKFGKDNKDSKSVKQISLDGKIIKEWIGIREIQRILGINQSSITKVCKGKNKTAGGYIWEYA